MVLQKRLDYGFNGYQVPPTPRSTRSARRRRSFKKNIEENQLCAFDLLAVVAGKLLLEGESSPSSSNSSAEKDHSGVVNDGVKKECQDEDKLSKVETHDQETPSRNLFVSETLLPVHEQNHCSKEFLYSQDDLSLGLASGVTADCAEVSNADNLWNGKGKNEMATFASKVEVSSSECRGLPDCKVGIETKRLVKEEPHNSDKVPSASVENTCSLEDQAVWDRKGPALVSSDSSAKAPLRGNYVPHSSYPTNRDIVNVVSRDDDENSSGCTHPTTTKKFFRTAPRIGDRRIRKILASKYWKVSPRLKEMMLSNTDGDFKPVYRKRKNYYKYQKSERIFPFKKRKHFSYSSPSNSDGGISGEFAMDSTKHSNDADASGSCFKMHGANGVSSSVAGDQTSFQPMDSRVKLRIQSFRVPELVIEIPESATVGSLKRTVMEAVTAILGGGLRVGVLVQGKKVRDDNKTLLQTGISQSNHLDALGFSLEPNCSQLPPPLCPGESPLLLTCDTPQPLNRYPPTPSGVVQGSSATSPDPHMANLSNFIESDHDSAPSPTHISIDKSATNSKALVPVPAMNLEALNMVPVHRKSKRSEIAQRRIRRPFSVAEVEALVQAVEKLGTGRWRDVKLRAFDNAKHRTYVDLKVNFNVSPSCINCCFFCVLAYKAFSLPLVQLLVYFAFVVAYIWLLTRYSHS
ncbi:hypothetical protein Tsubulata_038674 [Turnera subulata]|uniref:HTH myb-type domain-containing protein n=1 Tax=Turnera subulata TaxID=218843 RepID=A0A9Q0FK02_9ROSI|nr:hypothetical protein Tsubulata_038674 [Turnera subulata]